MDRPLHWNDYVRIDRETGARTREVIRLAVFPSAASSGREQVRTQCNLARSVGRRDAWCGAGGRKDNEVPYSDG